jgi:hypothetical protein
MVRVTHHGVYVYRVTRYCPPYDHHPLDHILLQLCGLETNLWTSTNIIFIYIYMWTYTKYTKSQYHRVNLILVLVLITGIFQADFPTDNLGMILAMLSWWHHTMIDASLHQDPIRPEILLLLNGIYTIHDVEKIGRVSIWRTISNSYSLSASIVLHAHFAFIPCWLSSNRDLR